MQGGAATGARAGAAAGGLGQERRGGRMSGLQCGSSAWTGA